MIEKIILGILIFNMLPKTRITYDDYGLRLHITGTWFHSEKGNEQFIDVIYTIWLWRRVS